MTQAIPNTTSVATQPRLSKEEINTLPLIHWQGPIQIINSRDGAEQAVEMLQQEPVLGFDTETRPAFKKGQHFPPSLLQLAGEDQVFIFQLQQTGLPKNLLALLNNQNIVKTGVAIAYDLSELNQLQPFAHQGFYDLGTMAKERGIQNHGLRGLAAVVLGHRISKSARVTNWAGKNLTNKQIRYAATDAWIGRKIYQKLISM